MRQQHAWLDRVFCSGVEAGAAPAGSGAAPVVKVLAWQWDETSQRVRGMLAQRFDGERLSHGKVAVQIMMQSGLCSTFQIDRGCYALQSSHEWLRRGQMLA